MLLNCGVEKTWESLGLQGDPTSPSSRTSVLGVHWKDWCWSWNSNTLATWCEDLTHSKRPWCWERLKAGGEGDDRGWDGLMASLTWWTWVWVNSGSWWWTGRPGTLWFMVPQSRPWMSDWTELRVRFVLRFCLLVCLFVFPLMGKAEWGGNPVCWWLGLYFCFVCCLDEVSCTGCNWWLGEVRSCIQVVSFVWVLTICYSLGLVLW